VQDREEIIIWASDVETIHACETAACEALKQVGVRATILINSEPPLIARNQLFERLPVVEIRGMRWSLRPGQPFTTEQLVGLFRRTLAPQEAGETPAAPARE
jgi:hypothetical protein